MTQRTPIRGQLVISKNSGRVVRVRDWNMSPAWFDGTAVGVRDRIDPARFWWRADFVKDQFREMTDGEVLALSRAAA
jgi:hypothetical protein